MDFTLVEPIAAALLYEGYLLYPYRTSALKNRQPPMFGSLYPRAYSAATGGTEPWFMQSEFLMRGEEQTLLQGRVRFLQAAADGAGLVQEREASLPECPLRQLVDQPLKVPLPGDGAELQAFAHIAIEPGRASVFKVRVRIENHTPVAHVDPRRILALTLLSTHTVFGVEGGTFLSLIDPPEDVRPLANACRNRGAWPVLIGDPTRRDMILAAPIILYDYPQVAAESPGDLFDATEIDELLTLRILTLSAAEKQILRHDPRTRELLDRTERLTPEQRLALHGAQRTAGAETAPLRPGARVRLHPHGHADILDLALQDEPATIKSIEQDVEGRIYYVVTLDADPGRDLGNDGKPGHQFFFRQQELEPL